MSNPFSDIIGMRDDRSNVTVRRVGALMKDLGIDTGDSPTPLGAGNTGTFFKESRSDQLEGDVEMLLGKLRGLIGDFDSSAITSKLSVVQKGLSSSTNGSNGYGRNMLFPSGTPSPIPDDSQKYGMHTPLSVKQARPFACSGRQVILETPRVMPTSGRRDSSRMSMALKSNRYSVGLNILSNAKRAADSPDYPSTPVSVASPKFTKDHPGTPIPMSPTSKHDLFAQFCIVDIDPDILSTKRPLERSNTQPTRTVYTFPETSCAIVDNLHEYCFPNGAQLRLIRAADWKRKRRTEYAARFQIMQFTDSTNRIYHACCLITTSKLSSGNPALFKQLEDIKIAVSASDTIKRALRRFMAMQRACIKSSIAMQWEENITRSRDPSLDPRMSTGGTLKAKHSSGIKSFLSGLKAQVMRKNRPGGNRVKQQAQRNGSWTTLLGGSKAKDIKPRTWSNASMEPSLQLPTPDERARSMPRLQQAKTPVRTLLMLSSDDDEDDLAGLMLRQEDTPRSMVSDLSDHPTPTPSKTRRPVFFPQDSPSSRPLLIAQKAYCILSEAPMPALFFQLLRAIASKDSSRSLQSSMVSVMSASGRSLRSHSHDGIADNTPYQSYASMHGLHNVLMKDFLSHVQSFDHKKVTNTLQRGTVNLSYPGYVDQLVVPKRIVSLEEWSTAVLIKFFPADVIVHVHASLLLEKSLVVLGSDPTFVSIICTAFLHLLKPFKWAGIFVPLLPPLAQEILDAPVPFIVGVATPELFGKDATHRPKAEIAQGASLLYLDDFERYGKLYKPMPADLNEFRTSITEMEHLLEQEGYLDAPTLRHFEPASQTDPPLAAIVDPHISTSLKDLSQQLTYMIKRYTSRLMRIYPMNDWNSGRFIKELLFDSDEELYRPVRKIIKLLGDFNETFAGSLLVTSHAWQAVGTVNAASGFYEVDPDRVVQPLKTRIAFQEHFIATQMFTLFADRCHARYEELAGQR